LLNSVVSIDRNSFSIDVAEAMALLDTDELALEAPPLVVDGVVDPLEPLTVVMEAPALFGLSDEKGR
jgi:hypothetical protein